MLWQAIRLIMIKDIDLQHVPELIRLAEGEEEMTDLLALNKETLLIRWVNYHMKKAGKDRRIKNLGKDMADSECYTTVMHQIDSSTVGMDNLDNENQTDRAKNVIGGAEKLGFKPYLMPSHIVSGNNKLNTIFTTQIFNANHGLEPLTKEEEEEYESVQLIDDDVAGTQEERAYRMWINSLNLEDVYINNLYEECKDGLLLLKVMDRIDPGIVNWKKVEKKPGKNMIKKQINC